MNTTLNYTGLNISITEAGGVLLEGRRREGREGYEARQFV